jgi:lipopolysaccharide biosynthesis glycosyltransferase
MKIAIVTSCTTSWLPYALATHYSLSRNVSLAVDHFVITDDAGLSQATDMIQKFSARYGIAIRHEHLNDILFAGYLGASRNFSTLYRLKLPQIIPQDYDRVLFLDSDVLVLRSVDEMLQTDMGGLPAAAVNDVWINLNGHKITKSVRQAIDFGPDDIYFNSGVMLFDWKKVLSEKIMEQALAILHHKDLHFPDQCALNLVFRKKWKALPIECNWLSLVDDSLDANAAIRHFTDARKPWSDKFRRKDAVHRKFYSDFLKSLGQKPLPAANAKIYANQAIAAWQKLKRRFKIWYRNRPDEMKQIREYVQQKTLRLPDH